MTPKPASGAKVLAGCLFFVGAGWAAAADPVQSDDWPAQMTALQAKTAQLTADLQQREATIRKLTADLAIARTESELFQQRWAEAQLRAQTLGVNFGDAKTTQAQRQLLESLRLLYQADVERQRLAAQLERLLAGIAGQQNLTAEVARAQALLATSALASGNGPAAAEQRPMATLESAKVLEVNPSLQLVVLDVGLVQGARVGMPLVVVRANRVVAELRIVEVRERICGALIESVTDKVKLVAGDAARVTKS